MLDNSDPRRYLAQQGPLPLKMAPGTVCQRGNDGKQYSGCFRKADFERSIFPSVTMSDDP